MVAQYGPSVRAHEFMGLVKMAAMTIVHEATLGPLRKSAEAVTYAEPAREASSSMKGQYSLDVLH